MSKIDKTYHKLIDKILQEGYTYEDPNRKGVNRIEIPSATFRHEFKDGFPSITTKKLHYKNVVTELIWFLKGSTNIKYLVDNGCNIWNKDAYNYYLKECKKGSKPGLDFEEFILTIKSNAPSSRNNYEYGDLGKVYGHYWRNYDGFDQIKDIIDKMINTTMSSEIIVTARNPNDKDNQALPCCFSEDMLVRKKNDYKKISDLKIGDEVLTTDSSFQKITNISKVPYKGTMKEIKIFGNSRKISCTPNHPFLIKEKGFIESKDIKNGDYVAIPINKIEEIPLFEEEIKIHGNNFKTKSLDFKKLDYWYLMGYFLGDGWLIDSKKEIFFSVADKDIDEVYDRFKSVLGIAKIKNNKSKCITFSGKNQILFNVLSKFGKYAHGKTIPEFILNAPKENIKEFLKGYQKADGCITKDGLSFTTVSDNIAYSLQLLYAKIGIKASVYYQNRPKTTIIQGRTVNQKNTYSVNIYKSIKKSKNYIIDSNYLWMKVVNVEDINFNGFVYNLSVENNHTYNVFNIINHNCHYGFQIVMRPLTFDEKLDLFYNKGYFSGDTVSYSDNDFEIAFNGENIPKYGFELHWQQRSVDTFLGWSYNVASYATLALILEKITGHKALGIQGDLKKVHLYDNSLDAVKEQLSRDVNKYGKCELKIDTLTEVYLQDALKYFDSENIVSGNFQLQNYESYPAINVEMLSRNE